MSENESTPTVGNPEPVPVLRASAPRSAAPSSDVAGALDPALGELLEIFEGPLRDATFPEVSHGILRGLAAEVEASFAERERQAALLAEAESVLAEAEAAVANARAALREAEGVVGERQRALLARGQRALSYAKVFAETDPALHARLSAISLARIAQRGRPAAAPRELRPNAAEAAVDGVPAAPRKRGRPPVARTAALPVDLSASG